MGAVRKDYITEIVLELLLGAVVLSGDLSDIRTVVSGELGSLGELISCAVRSFCISEIENGTDSNFSGSAEGSRNPGVIKFHGRLGC